MGRDKTVKIVLDYTDGRHSWERWTPEHEGRDSYEVAAEVVAFWELAAQIDAQVQVQILRLENPDWGREYVGCGKEGA